MKLEIYPEVTRIDLERQGAHVLAQLWNQGWQEGYMTDMCQYLVDTRIEDALQQCEATGFTVEMCDHHTGRALRGEITRIDFVDGKIKKYPFGWTAKTRPISERQATPDETVAAIQWCREHDWAVREWPGGARAWKGKELPVRDASAIRFLRRQVDNTPGDPRRQYDLAFCF